MCIRDSWSTTLHNYFPYLEKLKTSDIKTIDINPVRTETGEFLGSEWIETKPGTDCALMLGMMSVSYTHLLTGTPKVMHSPFSERLPITVPYASTT